MTLNKPPTEVNDTDAIFGYLEVEKAKRVYDTSIQRAKNMTKVFSSVRVTMTPDKIKEVQTLERMRKADARKKNKAKWLKDKAKRDEKLVLDLREQEKVKQTASGLWRKHFTSIEFGWSKKGKTVEKRRTKAIDGKINHCLLYTSDAADE